MTLEEKLKSDHEEGHWKFSLFTSPASSQSVGAAAASDVIRFCVSQNGETEHTKPLPPFSLMQKTKSANDANDELSLQPCHRHFHSSGIPREASQVRALACAPDGRRVAVGFHDGSTRIYQYNDVDFNAADGFCHHPFLKAQSQKKEEKKDDQMDLKHAQEKRDEEDDDDDEELFGADLLTQSDGFGPEETSKDKNKSNKDKEDNNVINQDEDDEDGYFAGPRFSAPIRSLLFDPRSSPSFGYFLAVASESAAGLCVVNVTSKSTLEEGHRYLASDQDEQGTTGGVRGMSYSLPPSFTNSTSSDKKDHGADMILAAINMDGKLSLYNVPTSDTPDVDWEWYHTDASPSVSRRDVGQLRQDPSKSLSMDTILDEATCQPAWSPCGRVLAVPGSFDVQLRLPRVNVSKRWYLHGSQEVGHVVGGEIVCLAFVGGADGCLVTGGRDGRVCVWDLDWDKIRAITRDNLDDSAPLGSFRCFLSPQQLTTPTEAQSVNLTKLNSPPTHMQWVTGTSEKGGFLCILSAKGEPMTISVSALGELTKSKISLSELEHDSVGLEDVGDERQDLKETPKGGKKRRLKTSKKDEYELEEDDEEEWTTPSESSKNGGGVRLGSAFVDDEADEDEDDVEEVNGSNKSDLSVEGDSAKEPLAETRDTVGVKEATKTAVEPTEKDSSTKSAGSDKQTQQNDAIQIDEPMDNDVINADDGDVILEDNDDILDVHDADHPRALPLSSSLPTHHPQDAFAPSSTPMSLTSSRRILCWNHMGMATSRVDDTSPIHGTKLTHIVDIAFVDSYRPAPPPPITDDANFDIGCVGEEGAMFATCGGASEDGDVEEKSLIYFHKYEAFGPLKQKDWTVVMPPDERVLGCACGEGWTAVVTSRRFLRLFGAGGVQDVVLTLPGDPVTIVGRSRFVAVFFHTAPPLPSDGTQQLGYKLFDVTNGQHIASGHLSALGPGTHLTWAGFSNDYSLAVMDSGGVLSMLTTFAGWSWVPILDTTGKKKSEKDSFWPISVTDGKLICVPLRGGHEHPDATTTRKPVTTSLELRMPVLRGTLPKSVALEDVSVRAKLAIAQWRFIHKEEESPESSVQYMAHCAEVDKVTIKLLYASLEAGRVERALGLVRRLHLEKSFDIAMTLSDQFHHRALNKEIEALREERFPMEDDEEEDLYGDEDYEQRDHYQQTRSNIPPRGRITPETPANRANNAGHRSSAGVKRVRQDLGDEYDSDPSDQEVYENNDSGEGDDQELVQSQKGRQSNQDATKQKIVRRNPFVKKSVTSPMKASVKRTPTKKPVLSRQSTFSAQSRKRSRASKTIL